MDNKKCMLARWEWKLSIKYKPVILVYVFSFVNTCHLTMFSTVIDNLNQKH